ncbi:hybrid sensor histidine kinase/response regulator [Thiocapsa rosea]|uniref:Chemotaxis protein CheA n=1 Tax=Thiocapsa rosea TaxID=69360 RepID=A0A495V5Y8_9GAMM|nr:hybrid sensor histidine kinase/response regulator [Thiocapsa rosea]RKT44801.1 two-component system chemotaxis sensor kinase CheA/two-component system sensor histidine kinase and response regulator WspE [Thiocapsa rosea]
MALDITKFIGRFVDEAREHIARLETGLATLGTTDGGGRDGIDALFRSAHTIKGSSRMLKLASIAETAHHLEDVLGVLREGKIQPDPALAALLMRAVDTIGAMIEEVAASGAGAASGPPDQALCERLARAAAGDWSEPGPRSVPDHSAAADASSLPDSIPAAIQSDIPPENPRPSSPAPDPAPTAPQPTGTEAATRIRAPESVRVRMDKLDALVKLMGEMVSNQARLRHILGEARLLDASARTRAARTVADPGAESAELARALHRFTLDLRDLTLDQERLIGELNDRALGMRMLPLGTVLDPIARIARELGRSLGKEIRCEVSGSEIELDRQIIDHLSDALVHLLRNAIDHGIESTEERLTAGKPTLGEIRVSARQEGGAVMIAIVDDGRGLDRARILEKAMQKGLIDAGASQEITDEQVADLIFQPGFSTSPIITEVSGRGVGLDVVKRAITDDLQGSVSIKSRPGAGTTLTLKLPLSLAVMRILLLEAGGHCFGISAAHVSELIRTSRSETIQVAGRPAVVLRNELVPLIPLVDLLGLPESAASSGRQRHGLDEETLLVVIIGVRQAKLGLVVDQLVDERDMVLKPLPEHMRGRGVLGGLVGGVVVTGTNALVSLLQAPALLDAARRIRGEAIKAAVKDSARRHDGQQGQHILVVDDSLNTREIEKEVLEASGYRVTLAEDGLDGWQKAVGGRFDAVLTDVEMPGLDGFSLTAKLRENDKYRSTPIIIVTSRQTREDKQRGIQVGADAYIVKGDFDQSNLVDTLRNLLG